MGTDVKDNIRMEKMMFKEKDVEGSKTMVRVDKLNMIKNDYKRLNFNLNQDDTDDKVEDFNNTAQSKLTAQSMNDTFKSVKSDKNSELIKSNNFCYYKMCNDFCKTFERPAGNDNIESAVKSSYESFKTT